MMLLRFFLAVTSLVLLVTVTSGEGDWTRTPGTSGSDVVNSVVNILKAACIFSDDRQFLRRLAYVESLDGTDPGTYRAGYNGGIWKVDEDKFNATRTCPYVIRPTCDVIQREFNIDWTTVTWSDLRKPLYSALAAALYLEQRMGTNQVGTIIPESVDNQTDFWTHYYHLGAPVRDFSVVAGSSGFECDEDMDLVFILDSSGSISSSNFNLSLQFVAQVVEAMKVPDVVKVATVTYSDSPHVEFYLNSYSNKNGVVNAIQSIRKISGGTATSLGLDSARNSLFNERLGARPQGSVKRVAVLVTDGASNSHTMTTLAAEKLRAEAGVTIFAIGVGGYNLAELQAAASVPVCTHVYTLSDFSDISSIITEIQRSVCTANTQLAENTTIVSHNNKTITAPPASENATVVVNVTCGVLDIYVSRTNPNPNPALFSERYTATEGRPAYLTSSTSQDGSPLYMTVIGSDLPLEVQRARNCSGFQYRVFVEEKTTEVKCCEGSDCKSCTLDQLRQDSMVNQLTCDTNQETFQNPCTPEKLQAGHVMFSFPYDPSKFIRCDYMGRPYVTQCPDGEHFNPSTLTCGYSNPGPERQVPLPATYPNPCTPQNLQAQYFYFEYSPDKHMYIHCDLWGDAWLQQCPEFEEWNQDLLTCIAERHLAAVTTRNPAATLTNPCTPDTIAAGRLFFPYPCDHTRFIHCDVSGNFWVQFCPGGMFFNPASYICVLGDPQGYSLGCP